MRVLVCGGRDFTDVKLLNSVLDAFHEKQPITVLIEGDARGADRMAGDWARKKRIVNRKFPANWEKFGRRAGPIRNQEMLDVGKPDLVIAFPGGRGTANMIDKSKKAKVKVLQI